MSDPSADFDPESREEREVAAEAAGDRSELLPLMAHTYRGEPDGQPRGARASTEPRTGRWC